MSWLSSSHPETHGRKSSCVLAPVHRTWVFKHRALFFSPWAILPKYTPCFPYKDAPFPAHLFRGPTTPHHVLVFLQSIKGSGLQRGSSSQPSTPPGTWRGPQKGPSLLKMSPFFSILLLLFLKTKVFHCSTVLLSDPGKGLSVAPPLAPHKPALPLSSQSIQLALLGTFFFFFFNPQPCFVTLGKSLLCSTAKWYLRKVHLRLGKSAENQGRPRWRDRIA